MGNRAGVAIGTVVVVGGALALIIWSSMGLTKVTGEICITYRGNTECRLASGTTKQEAITTATQMACSSLASGMTQRIACGDTPPSRTTWQE